MKAILDRVDFAALRRILPALGSRVAVVHDQTHGLNSLGPPHFFVVGVGEAYGQVRGTLDVWPLQSESVTGALVAVVDGAAAARTCREAARVLQPGGVAAFLATWPADDVRAFDEPLAKSGLEVARRIAIRRAGAPGAWAWLAAARARRATGSERVECAIVARRPGGAIAELPTAGGILASMFLPRGLSRTRDR